MIRFVPATGSTNRDLAARAVRGDHVAEGDWLVADRQTAGHGRSGRVWQDGAGNFMGSTIVYPRFGDPAAPTLALVAGLAVHAVASEALASSTGLESALVLKWPNDLIIGSAKLAGILLERERDAVVIGIGVNLAAAPPLAGRDTTSLAQLGADIDRDSFAQVLARQFDLDLQRWRDFGLAPIVRRWCAAAHPIGAPLSADTGSDRIDGTFAGLSDEGTLRLRLHDGTLREVHSGEVRLLDQVRG